MPSDESKPGPSPTLWTAAAPTGQPPVPEALPDPNVTRARVEQALKEAAKRAKAFSHPVTSEMLAKRY